MGSETSSKLSPWLANGSLSVRRVYHAVKKYEKDNGGPSKSTTAFIDVLLWRDFARFWCLKNDKKVFAEYGIYNRRANKWSTDISIV